MPALYYLSIAQTEQNMKNLPDRVATAHLWVVATPIGTLDDMPPRAVAVLRQVDAIAAEDTRHSGRLLQHFGIDTPLLAYHDHNEQAQAGKLVRRMLAGERLALISDAGTPLVSDPGYRLVAEARVAGLTVSAVPGPSAAVLALAISGLPVERFSFAGFPPAKGQVRQHWFEALANNDQTVVLYESSHRIESALEAIEQVFGPEHPVFLARELTKLHETTRLDPVTQLRQWLADDPQQKKGEFVLVIARKPQSVGLEPRDRQWLEALKEHLPPGQLARVTARVTGMKKKEVYGLF